MDQLQAVVVLTTWPAGRDVAPLAALVEERLAACVNVLPEMDSIYRWREAVERDREHQVFIKTTAARLPDVLDRVRELHPYEVPELLAVPVSTGGEAYRSWLAASTG
jgi:periplasmic divalent cation tolerance protein